MWWSSGEGASDRAPPGEVFRCPAKKEAGIHSHSTPSVDAASSEAQIYTAADVGFIAQNIYLYCAPEGLATVVRASIDKPALAKTLNLQSQQKIILARSVGYPKK